MSCGSTCSPLARRASALTLTMALDMVIQPSAESPDGNQHGIWKRDGIPARSSPMRLAAMLATIVFVALPGNRLRRCPMMAALRSSDVYGRYAMPS